MNNLLNSIKQISIKVTESKDIMFWNKNPIEYTLKKSNFRTRFKCPDSHGEDVTISDEIKSMIQSKKVELEFTKRCPGKDAIGRTCIAGFKFQVYIEYFE